jgi:phospholipid transport system substrate-binding protein
MIRDSKRICLLVFLVLALFSSPVFAAQQSPKQCVEELLGMIQKIKKEDKLTAEQKKANRARSEKALNYLNITVISQKALGKFWPERTDQEKEQFSQVLSELFITVAFPNSGKFFSDLDWIYSDPEIDKGKALIPIQLTHKDEGEIEIDFFLQQNSSDWKVVDVHLDGVSMRNNLRSQFYKIIAKDNFGELVSRMKKKLEESKV